MEKLKLLKNKYHSLSPAVKVSIWFMICSVLQKGISFITVPIFTRLLSTEDYGTFNLYQSWSSIISIFATLNLTYGVFNNGMHKYKNKQMEYTSSMQGLSTCTTLSLFVLYLIFSEPINLFVGLSTDLMVLMFISFIFSSALAFWSTRQRYNYKYIALVIITLSISILSPLTGIWAINISEYDAQARIYTWVLVSVFVSLFIYIHTFVKGKIFFNKEYWVFALKFNLPLIPHYLSSVILNQSDRIMIESMVGLSETGIYSVAYSVSMLMGIVSSSINSSFIPWTYKAIEKKEYQKIGQVSNMLLVVVMAMVTLSILFGPEIIDIMSPPQYYDAIWVIPPVAASVFFIFLASLFGNIEFYFEKTKYVMVASIIGAALNLILNFIFIPIFGYLAAGYTTLACYLVFALMHGFFMKKVLKGERISDNIYSIKFFLILTITMLAVVGVSLLLYNFTIIRYVFILMFLILIILFRYQIIKTFKQIKEK